MEKDVLKDHRKVVDIRPAEISSFSQLMDAMERAGGFGGRKVAEATGILKRMLQDKECTRFLSFPAAIMATGVRGVIVDMVRRGLFDVIVTTTGTLDHDLARVWGDYYHGDFLLDDLELKELGLMRLGNVVVPLEVYGPSLEEHLTGIFEELYREGVREVGGAELIRMVGERIEDDSSLLHWTARRGIPVFVPGFYDGAFGSHVWLFNQRRRDFRVDPLKDEQLLSDIVYESKRSGALILGGGISKHHTIWWNQFRGGLDYAVYVTTAQEHDGSLSGARMREAVSWGKVREDASYITVEAEITQVLPLMVMALYEMMGVDR